MSLSGMNKQARELRDKWIGAVRLMLALIASGNKHGEGSLAFLGGERTFRESGSNPLLLQDTFEGFD